MAFGSSKKVEELEAEVARLNQWVTHFQGMDAMALAGEVEARRSQVTALGDALDAVEPPQHISAGLVEHLRWYVRRLLSGSEISEPKR